jgi:hypothetical protein
MAHGDKAMADDTPPLDNLDTWGEHADEARELLGRYKLYEDGTERDVLAKRVEMAMRDPEVQDLMRKIPELAQYADKFPVVPPKFAGVPSDYPDPDNPEHADGVRLANLQAWINRITHEEGFHMACQAIPVDITAMAWGANKTADWAMSDVPLDGMEEDTGGLVKDPRVLERERLILMWLEAFVLGWKFHRDEESLEIIEGNRRFYADQIPSPRAPRPGVNRKQRRKKR